MPELKNCPKCGLFTDVNNKDCPYCGYHYADSTGSPPSLQPTAVQQPDIPLPPPLTTRTRFLQDGSHRYSFPEKITGILFRPTATFRDLLDEDLTSTVTYYAMLWAIYTVLITVLVFSPLSSLFMGGAMSRVSLFFSPLTFIVFIIAMGLVAIPLHAVWLHIFVYILGGRGGIRQTLKTVLYSYTPFCVISWIPIINLFGGIWAIIPEIIGIRELHRISTLRAIAALVAAVVVLVIILLVPLVFLGPSLLGAPVPVNTPAASLLPPSDDIAPYVLRTADLPLSVRNYTGRPGTSAGSGAKFPTVQPVSRYEAYYSDDLVPQKDSKVISHAIFLFPPSKLSPGTAQTLVNSEIANFKAGKFGNRAEMLPDPKLGDASVAFRVQGNYLGEKSSNNYMIEFAKGDVLEELVTGGPDPDYELLRDIAQRAAARIP
jgi:hypothetical protein